MKRAGLPTLAVFAVLCLFPARALFAQYIVSGKFVYEDRSFDMSGFTGAKPLRPIRFAEVRILSGGIDGVTIGSGTTTSSGSYAVELPYPVTQPVTTVCITSSTEASGVDLKVRMDPHGDFYSVASDPVAPMTNGMVPPMGTTVAEATTAAGKAFNIWDVAVDALQFLASPEVNNRFPDEPLLLVWKRQSLASSGYIPGEGRRVIVGFNRAYADTVIDHEIGHFINDVFSKDDSLGGAHYIDDADQDIRLSWSEGLASFLGSCIRKFKGYQRPDIYVATDETELERLGEERKGLDFSYEAESLGGSMTIGAGKRGSTSETAVTAALWDIVDGADSRDGTPGVDDDPLERPFSEVWKDLTRYMPTVTTHDISVEDFWDGWSSPAVGNGFLNEMRQVFAFQNGIDFIPDTEESDNSLGTAPPMAVSLVPPPVAGPKVRINEITMEDPDQIELYNAGSEEADLTGWKVRIGAAWHDTVELEIPDYRLAPGAYVMLSESASGTGAMLYLKGSIFWTSGSDGSCALIDSSGTGRDFVRWGDSDDLPPAGTSFSGPNPSSPSSLNSLSRRFGSSDTDTAGDWTPADPTPGGLNSGGYEVRHTYFPENDRDLAAFEASAGSDYIFETKSLANGAWTLLDLLASDGQVVLSNDNPGKSALMRWTAPASGRYFVRSRPSADPSNLARYGSYSLRIVAEKPCTVSRSGTGARFASLAEAVSEAPPGGTVLILDSGVYDENLRIAGSVTIRTMPGQSPVLSGGGPGAAVEIISGDVRIEGLRIRGGSPGILVSGGGAELVNCLISTGSASSASDGVRITGAGSFAKLVHCTVAGNPGSGISISDGASVDLAECIVSGNGMADVASRGGQSRVRAENTLTGDGSVSGGPPWGDPMFRDPEHGDFHLRASSPAIDRGDIGGAASEVDAEGIPRAIDGDGDGRAAPDLGAYEYIPDALLARNSLFPQVALGGGYTTSLFAVNPGPDSAMAKVSVNISEAGKGPADISIRGRAAGRVYVPVPALGAVRLQPASGPAAAAGFAAIESSLPLAGSALFQRLLPGEEVLSQAGIGLSAPGKSFTIYVDRRSGADTGYAMVNGGPETAYLHLTLRDPTGGGGTTASFPLAPGEHLAEFAGERFGAAAPAGFEGTIEVACDRPVSVAALRFDNPAQDVFSAIPILDGPGAETLCFPQIADGGGYRTSFMVINRSVAGANVTVEFLSDEGAPLELPVGGAWKSRYEMRVEAGGAASFSTGGYGAPRTGWAKLTSSVPVGGAALFQRWSGAAILSEAAVLGSSPALHLVSLFDSRGYTESGFALGNPGSERALVRLRLHNTAGEVIAARSLSLPGYGHIAGFLARWFGGYEGSEGTLEIVSDVPVCGVALRYDNLGGNVFATLPMMAVP